MQVAIQPLAVCLESAKHEPSAIQPSDESSSRDIGRSVDGPTAFVVRLPCELGTVEAVRVGRAARLDARAFGVAVGDRGRRRRHRRSVPEASVGECSIRGRDDGDDRDVRAAVRDVDVGRRRTAHQ